MPRIEKIFIFSRARGGDEALAQEADVVAVLHGALPMHHAERVDVWHDVASPKDGLAQDEGVVDAELVRVGRSRYR